MVRGGCAPAACASLSIGEELDEAQLPAAVAARADLDLVRERPDDLDSEPALLGLGLIAGRHPSRLEARAHVADLRPQPVELEQVDDLDVAAAVPVRVLDRVRA